MSRPTQPQRRGEQLRRHILMEAKEVFLEAGYERASMDTVALRAGTSKRSLYAHFESKDKLFSAVLDLVRELYLGQMKTPDAYAEDPTTAVARFCGRFLQMMMWEPLVRTCRLTISEAERLPDSSRAYFEAIFVGTQDRLSAYLSERYAMDATRSAAVAADLLARTVLPRLLRTLLAMDQPSRTKPEESSLAQDVDLDTIYRLVSTALHP